VTFIDLRFPPSDPLQHKGEHIGEPWRDVKRERRNALINQILAALNDHENERRAFWWKPCTSATS